MDGKVPLVAVGIDATGGFAYCEQMKKSMH